MPLKNTPVWCSQEKKPLWHRGLSRNNTEIVTCLFWDLKFLWLNMVENVVRIRASADLLWICCCCFLGVFFPLFFFQHKPTLCVCGWTCICAYMCCEWEQGHCWGLGFVSEDLLKPLTSTLEISKWAWISAIFHILLLSSLPHIHAYVGSTGLSDGKFWYPFSAQHNFWCLTGALSKNMATVIMHLWLKICFLFLPFFHLLTV